MKFDLLLENIKNIDGNTMSMLNHEEAVLADTVDNLPILQLSITFSFLRDSNVVHISTFPPSTEFKVPITVLSLI